MSNRGIAAAACLGLLVGGVWPGPARGQGRQAETIWDVRTSPAGQIAIYNPDPNGSALGMPCAAADLDGDGADDAILAPFLAPSGTANDRGRAGELRIVFGRRGTMGGAIETAAPSSNSVLVWGARQGDFLGNEVDAFDVTGDGLGDVLACAQNADGFGTNGNRPGAGMLYIIHGRTAWPETIDLATEPAGVTQILGATAGERCGFWATAGDVTGDGVKDVLVSADLSAGSTGVGASRGKLYIIPGRASFPARIDLADAAVRAELGVVEIYGVDDCDHFGSCIAAADFDGDGIDDVACSSGVSRAGAGPAQKQQGFCSRGQGGGGGPANDRPEAGEVYVIYGRSNWPAKIELATPPADVAIYYGQTAGDHFGEDVRTGDFDGDGVPELAVGALTAAAPSGMPGQPSRSRAGVGYIFWGALMARGERVDTREINTSNPRMTRIYGERAGDIGADTIALVDVDMDGRAEMVFASPLYDPAGRPEAGDLKVIFGRADRLPGVVDLAAPPAGIDVFRVIAADSGDMFAYSFTHGDFDGDGFRDLIPNAMGGDGMENCCRDAGELYVISGLEFARRAGRGPSGSPCVSRAEVSSGPGPYYAGQSGIEIRIVCDDASPSTGFVDGTVAIVNGVETPATVVDARTLVVRLDDVESVRNTAGVVMVAARNPGAPASGAVNALTLIGPEITKVKAKRKGGDYKLNIKGANFLAGATVAVTDGEGGEVAVTSVTRKNAKKMTAIVPGSAVERGATISVRVVNPGPALSAPRQVVVP